MKRRCVIIAPALLTGAFATLLFATLAFARPLAAPPTIATVTPASAVAGQAFTVVIAGANFEVTSTVTLNSVALSVSSATAETITATAGAGAFNAAGVYPLVVTTSEGQASSTFEIVAGPAAQISIAPASASMVAGGSLLFTAAVSDALGNPISAGTVNWSMPAGSGTPSFSGQTSRSVTFSITTAGAKTIQASYAGAPDAIASVNVNPGLPLLSVTPASAVTIDAGGNVPFSASVTDIYGNSVTTDTVQWLSNAGSFTVNSGNATTYTPPTTPATYLVTATLQSTGQPVQRQVTVQAGPATQISLLPATSPINVAAGNTVLFTATLLDAANNPTTNGVVNWEASAGSFSGSGNSRTYTPPTTPATYLVTATLQSTSQAVQRQVVVQAGAATQITLQPPTSPINVVAGNAVLFTATLLDAANNPTTNGVVNWDASAGSFSGSGNSRTYTPPTIAGAYLVTATLAGNGAFQSRQVVVGAAAASAISIEQSATSITAGNSAWLTATVRDSFNNIIASGVVTWSKVSGPGTLSDNPPRSATLTTGAGIGSTSIQAHYPGIAPASATIAVNAGNPAQMSFSPLNPTITAGGSVAFTALVSDSFGNPTSAGSVAWAVTSGPGTLSNPQPRAVTFTSTVAAPSVVRAQIAGAPDATTTVTVNPAGVARITLSPPAATLPVNAAIGFSAAAFDAYNNAIPNAVFAWSSANTTKATVIASGSSATLTAKTSAGVYANLLRVTSAGITQTATITITPGPPSSITLAPAAATLVVSMTQSFNATVFDAFGNAVPNTALFWSVSGAQVGQIAATSGSTAILTGSTVAGVYPAGVRVSTGSITKTATITLTAGALNAVTLNPNGITIMPTGVISIVATGLDRFGNPISGLTFNWSVIGGAGIITPSTPGSSNATFTASTIAGSYPNSIRASTSHGGIDRTGRADVLITTDQVARIDISPASATLPPTAQQVFTARGYDRFNNLIWPLEVGWNVNGTGLINKTGSVTATFEAGTIAGAFPNAISAATQGITGTASITVIAGPLNTITVDPAEVVIGISSQQPFHAAGYDAWGNPVPNFSADWSIVPASAGTFDSTNPTTALFHAGHTPGIYNNAVRASSGGVSGGASVVIKPGTVAAVKLSPTSATLPVGGVQVFTAAVLDSAGNALSDLWVVWQVSKEAGAIESHGPLTVAVKAGTTAGAFAGAVQAFNGIFNASADLTIQAGTTSGININAMPATLQTNGTASSVIEIQLIDAYGNPTGAGMPVQWEIVQCSGECALTNATSQADASGRARTAIRSNHRVPQGATSTIIVRAVAGGLNKTVTLTGQFTPFTLHLPLSNQDAPLNNHGACTALHITPPQVVQQPANNAFNIYRFTATTPTVRVSLANYGTSGSILLYRIVTDNCRVNNTVSVVYLGLVGITSPTSFETAFNDQLTPGQSYFLVINTIGALTSQPYIITIQP